LVLLTLNWRYALLLCLSHSNQTSWQQKGFFATQSNPAKPPIPESLQGIRTGSTGFYPEAALLSLLKAQNSLSFGEMVCG
jgi:hypothetical protein